MGEPLVVGFAHLTVADLGPGVAETLVGVFGTPMTTGAENADGGPGPPLVIARTRNL